MQYACPVSADGSIHYRRHGSAPVYFSLLRLLRLSIALTRRRAFRPGKRATQQDNKTVLDAHFKCIPISHTPQQWVAHRTSPLRIEKGGRALWYTRGVASFRAESKQTLKGVGCKAKQSHPPNFLSRRPPISNRLVCDKQQLASAALINLPRPVCDSWGTKNQN